MGGPDALEIACTVGLDASAIKGIEILSERHGHGIWRILTVERSYVLKWLPTEASRIEIKAYELLRRLGVPTLPVHGSTDAALLLEDLAQGDSWRLANEADLARSEVAQAVARWYHVFHKAGERWLSTGARPGFLTRETDELTPERILAVGQALGLPHLPVWKLAANHIELLQRAAESLSVTLNYNDFYWTNLALSGRRSEELEAIVFDYHLLGVGMPYSDVRNVTSSLSGSAKEAFRDAYGPTDPLESVLDRPLATLHGLHVAGQMTPFPRWAETTRAWAVSGELQQQLLEAIRLARSLAESEGLIGQDLLPDESR